MIEVQLVQKSKEKNDPKKIVVEIGALHNTSYYLAQLAFRNIDEENLEAKVSGKYKVFVCPR